MKTKGATGADAADSRLDDMQAMVPLKKRRLVQGKELVFRQPGEDSSEEEEAEEERPASQLDLPTPSLINDCRTSNILSVNVIAINIELGSWCVSRSYT